MSEKRNTRKAGKPQGKTPAEPVRSPIDLGLLTRIVELMSANDLNTIDVRDGEQRVILKRGPGGTPFQMMQAPSMMAPAPMPAPAAPPAAAGPAAADESGFSKITSPMVGTFYAAAKPGEKPFVIVGSTVSEETDVCIVEAMKTFNNIKAECRGTVAKILVHDGQPVEFGTVLFLVKPS